MKPTAEMAKVKNSRFNGLATRHPVKLVVGLVLGAVVLSGTALYFGPNQFQEEPSPVPGSIASNELTGNDFRVMEEQRAADRQDDLRDMIQYWNELKEDEAASPSSSSQITGASQAIAYWVQRDEAEEMAYDELSKNFVGIAAPSSQTIAEHPFGSLLPDTPYYRDPDWREGQVARESGFDSPYPDTPYYQDPDWREGQAAK